MIFFSYSLQSNEKKTHKCTAHVEIIPSSLPSQIKTFFLMGILPSYPSLLDVQLIVYFFLRNRKLVHSKNPQLFVFFAMKCISTGGIHPRKLKQIAGFISMFFFSC